jgi:hypothetical protein
MDKWASSTHTVPTLCTLRSCPLLTAPCALCLWHRWASSALQKLDQLGGLPLPAVPSPRLAAAFAWAELPELWDSWQGPAFTPIGVHGARLWVQERGVPERDVHGSLRGLCYSRQAMRKHAYCHEHVQCGSKPRVLLMLPPPQRRCDGSCMLTDAVGSSRTAQHCRLLRRCPALISISANASLDGDLDEH